MAILERAGLEVENMSFGFSPIDHEVLRETVSAFLEQADRPLSLITLLVMVGLADHLMLKKVGVPLSGDDYFMLPNGPMPVRLFKEMRVAEDSGQPWQGRVSVSDAELSLIEAGDGRRLSRGQREIIDDAFRTIYRRDINELVDAMSEACPDWLENILKFVTLKEVYVAFGAHPLDAAAQADDVRSYYATEQ